MKKFKLIVIILHLIGEAWDWWTNSIDAKRHERWILISDRQKS